MIIKLVYILLSIFVIFIGFAVVIVEINYKNLGLRFKLESFNFFIVKVEEKNTTINTNIEAKIVETK